MIQPLKKYLTLQFNFFLCEKNRWTIAINEPRVITQRIPVPFIRIIVQARDTKNY